MRRAAWIVILLLAATTACKKERVAPKAEACPPPPTCSAPAISETSSITVERSRCGLMPCPLYAVTLQANGSVTVLDKMDPDASSVTRTVDPSRVRALLHEAAMACFHDLRDYYVREVTDARGVVITVSTTAGTKRIHVYPDDSLESDGCHRPTIAALHDLGRHVDDVAGTKAMGRTY
jgi:hypothetical protein